MTLSKKISKVPHRTRKAILIAFGAVVAIAMLATVGLWRTKAPAAPKSVLGEGLSNTLSTKGKDLPTIDDVQNQISNSVEKLATEKAKDKISQQTFLATTHDNELTANETKILRNVPVSVQKIRFNSGVTVIWLNISNQSPAPITVDLGTTTTLRVDEQKLVPGDLFDPALQVSLAGFGEPLKEKFTLNPQEERWGFLLFDPISMKGRAQLQLSRFTNTETNQGWDYVFDLNFDELAKAKPSTK